MKKKILIITANPPYPVSHGGAVAQYFFLEKLGNDFEVDIIVLLNNEKEKEDLLKIKNQIEDLNIITYLPTNVKQKKSLKHYSKLLFNLFFKIFGKQNRKESLLSALFEFTNSNFSVFLNNHFLENQYDLCQLEFFETLKLAPLIPLSVKKIFIHHEIRFKKYRNTLDITNPFYDNLVSSTKLCELAFLNVFDKIIVFNNEDLTELNELSSKVEMIPFGIPGKLVINRDGRFDFQYFFFLGAESHRPNRDGLEWFLNNIFIPEYGNLKKPIKIIGKWTDKFKSKFLKYEFIQFTGFVSSLKQFYQEGILVAPILSGSGLRTKILESMANNVPIICTPFAAEGLFSDNNNDHFLFFHDRKSFMEKINNELNNFEARKELVRRASCYFESNFNSTDIYKRRLKVYDSLFKDSFTI
jgi:glycosyltransferase involved in cell wall biosynthesis